MIGVAQSHLCRRASQRQSSRYLGRIANRQLVVISGGYRRCAIIADKREIGSCRHRCYSVVRLRSYIRGCSHGQIIADYRTGETQLTAQNFALPVR
jgi:hypothetical protein